MNDPYAPNHAWNLRTREVRDEPAPLEPETDADIRETAIAEMVMRRAVRCTCKRCQKPAKYRRIHIPCPNGAS